MAENLKTESFETFLVEHGFITKALYDSLAKQAEESKQSVVNLIIAQKILSPEALAQSKGAFLNIPYVNFSEQEIPAEIYQIIPKETRNFYHVFSFERNGSSLKVATTDPTNIAALEALEFFSKKNGYNIQLYVTDEPSFVRVLNKQEKISEVVGEAVQQFSEQVQQEKKENQAKRDETGAQPLQELIQDAPISKIVDVIMTNAINANASDIHVEPEENELRIRFRIDGILKIAVVLPKNVENAIVSKIKILSNLKIDEQRLPQDGRFHYDTGTRQVDLRVSILPNINGEKVVMRILDKTIKAPTLEDLGYRGKALDWSYDNIKKTHGIFLITGPTGSGKSTTLYSILSLINKDGVNIVTLEDPVEYFIEGVNQTQINPDIGLTFASGLRSVLRQDPNIIMVGEIRDKETAELAVQSALTGHLVLSTLHTNSAVGALPRLIDMGIEPYLLVASIVAVGAQRLARKICPYCKTDVEVPEAIRKDIVEVLKGLTAEELKDVDLNNIKLSQGKGCEKCNKTGYLGRIAICELFQTNNAIDELVLKSASEADIFEEARKTGMISMKQDGFIKVVEGVTTYEEVVRITSE